MTSDVTVPVIRGLSELADDYDAFILDLWGVVHGGVEPYPGVVDALDRLRAAGKRVALLSNAPRRRHHIVPRLARMGLGPEHYDRIAEQAMGTPWVPRNPRKIAGPAQVREILELAA